MSAALHRAGPPAGVATRSVRTRSGEVRVVALVEVWGEADPARRAALEQSLAGAICEEFGSAKGSTTARIRQGLARAERALRAAGAGATASLGAGTGVIAFDDVEFTVAQVGPSVAYGPGDDGPPERFPAESPWLKRGERTVRPDLAWPALGTAPGGAPIVHWQRFDAVPGRMLVVAETAAAEHLGREVIEALFATPAGRAGHALDVALPEGIRAVVVALPGPKPAPAAPRPVAEPADALTRPPAAARLEAPMRAEDGARPDGEGAEDGASLHPGRTEPEARARGHRSEQGRSSRSEPLELGPGSAADPRERLADSARAAAAFGVDLARRSRPIVAAARRALSSFGLASARVLVGLLPSRTPDGVRAEWARLMAAIAIGLPLAVLIVAAIVAARARSNATPDAEIPAGAPSNPVLPLTEASDEVRGIRRLEVFDVVGVPLSGGREDERDLVVAAGVPYVLNRELGRVERIDEPSLAAVVVLQTGSVVGRDVVGAVVDLFLLPGTPARADAEPTPGAVDPGGGEVEGAAATAGVPGADAGAAAAGRERLGVLDSAGRLWAIDGDVVSALPIGPDPRWRAVSRAAAGGGAVYALDRSGQIYRYPDGGGEGTAWLAGGETLDRAVDLAVGGSLWVLFGDGRLVAYAGGRPASLGPLGMPAALREPRAIFATADGDRLLVSDAGAGAVFVLDRDGAFVGELRLPAQPAAEPGSDAQDGRFGLLHGAWWQAEAELLWIVAGDLLYRAHVDVSG